MGDGIINSAAAPAPAAAASAQKKSRIWELDFIRGLCVALMIGDHFLYDLGFIFYGELQRHGHGLLWTLAEFARGFYWAHPLRLLGHFLVVGLFIAVCGISCSFSRSNAARGLKLLAVAAALTLATWGMDLLSGYQDFFIIRFGVLHMLSLSILLYAALQKLPPQLTAAIGLLLFAVGLYYFLQPPSTASLLLYCLLPAEGFYSADYFPLLPYCGLLLLGAAGGAKLYRRRVSLLPRAHGGRSFLWLGRHALLAYILHQPLLYGLLLAIMILFVR
ncbi:MAG: heparan-alpha-glucosaminide N-acetyltransferase domain-containing protein [Bacillota bacterium]|nr:heparan-alpha-glucosaminide N-acetyltransferase domain-containing protein [Bacillota bacterium]